MYARKLRPFYVKSIVCRSLNLAVGRLKKKKKQKMEKIVVCPISVYNVSGVLYLLFEYYSVQNHFKTMVRPLNFHRSGVCRLFPMYGSLGRSAPSLHRESTDSLIGYSSSKLSYWNGLLWPTEDDYSATLTSDK